MELENLSTVSRFAINESERPAEDRKDQSLMKSLLAGHGEDRELSKLATENHSPADIAVLRALGDKNH